MRYAIDLDGVIADFHAGFSKLANKLFPGAIPPNAQPVTWNWDEWLSSQQVSAVFAELRRTRNFWYFLPAIAHNVGAIYRYRLRFPEDEIFYVTARKDRGEGQPVMHQSQRWLDECGIAGLGTAVIVTNGDIKVDLYHELSIDAAVDDDPKHLPPDIGYVLATPWNASDDKRGLVTVKNLDEFFGLARDKV